MPKKKMTYKLGPKASKSDAVVNDLVAQWAGKDLQPWLAQAGKDYPELRSYQLGRVAMPARGLPSGGSGRTGGRGRIAIAPTTPAAGLGVPGGIQAPATGGTAGGLPTTGIPTAGADTDPTYQPLTEIGTEMKGAYGEFKDWLGTQRADVEGAAGRAGADVAGQAEIARQSEARRMMGMGIDPTSGRFGALSRRSTLDEARNKAAAMTRARGAERTRATGLRMAGEQQLTGMMGQRAGVAGDIAGLRDVGAGREWATGERTGSEAAAAAEARRQQRWATGERTGSEAARAAEEAAQREWTTGERTGSEAAAEAEAARFREWQAGQTGEEQEWTREERIGEQDWQEQQRAEEAERQRIEAARGGTEGGGAGGGGGGGGQTPIEYERTPGPGGSYYNRPVGWGAKKGGRVSPNVYKVGEGGTKKRPRPELYVSDRGGIETVGKKGPEIISVRESGLIIPHPKTVKEMKTRKCGGKVIKSRQRGGRVSPGGQSRMKLPQENIMKAIGTIKGSYDAKIMALLEGIGQGRRRRGTVPIKDLTDPYKRVRGIEKLKQSKLSEIARYYGIKPAMLNQIPAIAQGYREERYRPSRGTRKQMLERTIAQERSDFDPNYPGTP